MTQHDVMNQAIAELSNMDNCQALCHQQNVDAPIPNTVVLGQVVDVLRSILFPGYFGSLLVDPQMLQYQIGVRVEEVNKLLAEQIFAGICFTDRAINLDQARKQAKAITTKFIGRLPALRAQLGTDVEATYQGDPAAQSCMEVIFC